jgi:hypothetical protein
MYHTRWQPQQMIKECPSPHPHKSMYLVLRLFQTYWTLPLSILPKTLRWLLMRRISVELFILFHVFNGLAPLSLP